MKKVWMSILLTVIMMSCFFFISPTVKSKEFPPLSRSPSLVVDYNGTGDYQLIQDAIDNATDGDEIYISPGEYFENLIINNTVSLIGSNDGTVSLIGNLSIPIIDINANSCQITKLSIMGSDKTIVYDEHNRLGIHIKSSGISINNCIFYNNLSNGILIEQTTNNNIIHNNVFNSSNGIVNYNSNELSIQNCTFYDNHCGIEIVNSNGCIINNNKLMESYWGISIIDSEDINIFSNQLDESWKDISLERSNKIVVINNTITNGNQGIELDDSSGNNIIENNQFSCSWYSIRSLGGDRNQILNNTCIGGSTGIELSGSNWNIVTENLVKGQSYYGIDLSSSENNQVTHNTIQDIESNGISVYFHWDLTYEEGMNRGNNIISNNYIESKGIGISLRRTGNINLKNNSLENCGLFYVGNCYINQNEKQIEKSNTINGKPIYFFKGLSNFEIPMDASQIKLLECSDIIIENRALEYSPLPIVLRTCERIVIRNNTMNNVMNGIEIVNSNNITIINNQIKGIEEVFSFSLHRSGIYMSWSNDNIILNNSIVNVKSDGICLYGSHRNLIEYNIFSSTESVGLGIYYESNYNVINNNIICNNAGYGIEISSGNNNIIKNNEIHNNNLFYTHHEADILESQWSSNNVFINNTGSFKHGYNLEEDDDSSEIETARIIAVIIMVTVPLVIGFSIGLIIFIHKRKSVSPVDQSGEISREDSPTPSPALEKPNSLENDSLNP